MKVLIEDAKLRPVTDVVDRPSIDEFLNQGTPYSLPYFVEDLYFSRDYQAFAADEMEKFGIDPHTCGLSYHVLDLKVVSPTREAWIPFMILSAFGFKDDRWFGPLVGGHLAGLSMLQPSGANYAKQTLPDQLSNKFSVEGQSKFLCEALSRLAKLVQERLVVAIPNRGRIELDQSPVCRLLLGGRLDDTVAWQKWQENCLNFRLYSPTAIAFEEYPSPSTLGSFDFYLWGEPAMLADPSFVKTTHVIRHLGEQYKRSRNFSSAFDPRQNVDFWVRFLNFFN